MLSLVIVAGFFLMLLTPCVLAMVNQPQLAGSTEPLPHFLWTETTEEPAAPEPTAHTFLPAAPLSALKAAQAEAEYTQAEAASIGLEVVTLEQQLAAAQQQALLTRMAAARARANALSIAHSAAAERAQAAAERANAARQLAEQASEAAAAARALARERAQASAAEESAQPAEPEVDHPALHYPRAHNHRRAA
jgi:hypothetical protein